jgi:hypothetical protein
MWNYIDPALIGQLGLPHSKVLTSRTILNIYHHSNQIGNLNLLVWLLLHGWTNKALYVPVIWFWTKVIIKLTERMLGRGVMSSELSRALPILLFSCVCMGKESTYFHISMYTSTCNWVAFTHRFPPYPRKLLWIKINWQSPKNLANTST